MPEGVRFQGGGDANSATPYLVFGGAGRIRTSNVCHVGHGFTDRCVQPFCYRALVSVSSFSASSFCASVKRIGR
jgi:hypothetical protein